MSDQREPDAVVPAPADTPAERESHWSGSIVALLVTTFCSAAAALAGLTALGKAVFDLTNRELDLGLLGLAEFLPAFLLVLVTGTVADRVDRRLITGLGSLVEAACAMGLAFYLGSSPTAVGPIFGLVVIIGVGRAFASPAYRAMPADLLPPEHLPWLVARFSFTWQAALIAGPVLGGTLYAVDPQLPFYAMTVLFLAGGVAIAFVRPKIERPVATERPDLTHAMEGLRFIRREPVLLGAISLDLFAVLFGGAVALLPALAEERYGVGAVGLGWLRAAGGIGAAAVTLVLARRPITRHVGRVLLTAVAVFGLFTIVLGLTTSFVIAFVAMLVLSGADAISVFIRATLVPLIVPTEKRGRVMAVEMVFIGASNELGAFESGVAGQALGPAGAVCLGGAATLCIALGWRQWFPALREVDRFPNTPAGALSNL